MVAPFMQPLKKWIAAQRKRDRIEGAHPLNPALDGAAVHSEYVTDDVDTQIQYVPHVAARPHDPVLQQGHFLQPTTAQTQADASAQLKRLLSVNPQTQQAPQMRTNPPLSAKSESLLTLLRQPSASEKVVPTTPLEQVRQAPMPQSPQPEHVGRNNISQALPPPHYPVPADLPAFTGHLAHGAPQQMPAVFNEFPEPMRQELPAIVPGAEISHRNQTWPVQGPRYTENDKQFAERLPTEPYSASASTQPKLLTHAQSLLDTFRAKQLPPRLEAAQVSPQHSQPAVLAVQPSQALQTEPIGPQPQLLGTSRHQRVESRSRQALAQAEKTLTIETEQRSQPILPSSPLPATRTAHQENLLKMFRNPSSVDATGSTKTSTTLATSNPVELSASPTPRQLIYTEGKAEEPEPITKSKPNPVTILKPPRHPSAVSGNENTPLLSARLRAPTNLPDMDHVERAVTQHGRSQDSAKVSDRAKPAPIQILKRPTENPATSPGSDKQARSPTYFAELKGTTPTSFRPQILKRPQSSSHTSPRGVVPHVNEISASPVPLEDQTTTNTIKQPATAAGDHKQTLLSLFSRPSPSPIVSPISARPELAAFRNGSTGELGDDGTRKGSLVSELKGPSSETLRSRMNSVTSAPREPSFGRESKASRSQTPMSPADRGFLLSFMDSVVKNGGN